MVGMPRGIVASPAIALAAALSLVPLAVPAAAALPPDACRVREVETGTVRGSLQEAVDAAGAGHHLVVRGTCHGLTTIGRSLVIRGLRTATSGVPTLDGDRAGTVLTIDAGAIVTLRDLVIQHGRGAGRPGGGIINAGVVDLLGTTRVRANQETGIANVGVLRLHDRSQVVGNTGGGQGGGVWNAGTLVLEDQSAIRANRSLDAGGGIWNNGGRIRIGGQATVRGNRAGLSGGGIFSIGGTVRLWGRAQVRDNRAGVDGGGIATTGALVIAGHARIAANTAAGQGGGVASDGPLTMRDAGSIVRNEAIGGPAGGLWSEGGPLVGVRCAPAVHPNIHHNEPANCRLAAAE